MTQKITRKRALELAQNCIMAAMSRQMEKTNALKASPFPTGIMIQKSEDAYAELAAALKIIENMARQKEMHL